MRHVVLDSSVAVAWVLGDEPAHEAAVRVRSLVVDGAIEPNVAGHFDFEVRSALVQAARRGRIEWGSVAARFDAIGAIEPVAHSLADDDARLIGLCRDLQVSWADAHWLVLAATLDLPLVTADARLARSVPDTTAIVVPVTDIGRVTPGQ